MSLLLQFHIALGAAGLLAGLGPLLLTKGTKLHTRLGFVFTAAMLLTGVTALFLTEANPANLLTPLAILMLNQCIVGHAALYAKMRPFASLLSKVTLLATVVFLGYSLYVVWPLLAQGQMVGIVTVVIAGGLVPLSIQDARHLFGQFSRKLSIRIHASRMVGTYIGASVAFLVNAVSSGWGSVAIPSMIGVGLIIYWSARISKRGLEGMEMGNMRFGSKRA
ncbi:MAG: hypothetical protein AB8F78_03975 [Saprospiraceae bacterium]